MAESCCSAPAFPVNLRRYHAPHPLSSASALFSLVLSTVHSLEARRLFSGLVYAASTCSRGSCPTCRRRQSTNPHHTSPTIPKDQLPYHASQWHRRTRNNSWEREYALSTLHHNSSSQASSAAATSHNFSKPRRQYSRFNRQTRYKRRRCCLSITRLRWRLLLRRRTRARGVVPEYECGPDEEHG